MAQKKINAKLELGRMKRGSEVSINGYTIKKVGTTWNVKKGDFYNRSFTEDRLPKLIEKLEAPTKGRAARKIARTTKKANRMAAKLVAKNQKVIRKAQKADAKVAQKAKAVAIKVAKKAQKVVEKQAAKEERAARPFRRNRVIAEASNLVVQGSAYFAWFVYFFTDYVDQYLGEYSLYALAGISVLALLTHFLYSRQLGIRHRIANIIVGLLELGAVVGAAVLYFGPLTHTGIVLDDILPSVEEAFTQLETISLVSFMFVKWVLLFVAKKK